MYFLTKHQTRTLNSTILSIGALVVLMFIPVNPHQRYPLHLAITDFDHATQTVQVANVAEIVETTNAEQQPVRKQLKIHAFFPISFTDLNARQISIESRMEIHAGNHLTNRFISPAFPLPLRI
jgi:hypothetical protein